LDELQYKAKLFPFGPVFALILCLVVIFGQFYANEVGSIVEFLASYIGAIAFVLLWILYKVVKKTKWVKSEEADLTQGFATQD
jgi:lysine-specific permease